MALNRDAILGVNDLLTEKVDVPEWGGEVIVRGLTGEERDAYEASRRQIRNAGTPQQELVILSENMRAGLLVKCLIDENGDRLFTDQDAGLLGMKNGRTLDRLFDVASRLSGLSDEEAEQMEGNSVTASEDAASTSSSPETSDAPSQSY
ncbi:phage tail assembly chaperone [Streptomyces cyanogenus]|uniref:Phage tail assembly chaperone n=1 Tax=Streptomyces cyanogenus TaxID=80860 RepID=A0ABX7TJX6_STRCY|nr:phage tail assembly chaperone [Streptomyces cyanogenus]QTD96965.1 Phage tail assembly chaperone [Streptomyces cyanogenus]